MEFASNRKKSFLYQIKQRYRNVITFHLLKKTFEPFQNNTKSVAVMKQVFAICCVWRFPIINLRE